MELVSGILGGEPIALSSELQVMCDALMRARPDYLLLVDDQGSIRFATNACEELFGRGATALANESLVSLIAPPDRPLLEEFIRQQLTPLQGQTFAKVGPLDLRVIQVDPDTGATTLRWVAIRVASADLFGDSHASGASYFFSLTDITHREAEEEQILKKLNFDALTSLPSRYNILAQITTTLSVIALASSRRFIWCFSIWTGLKPSMTRSDIDWATSFWRRCANVCKGFSAQIRCWVVLVGTSFCCFCPKHRT